MQAGCVGAVAPSALRACRRAPSLGSAASFHLGHPWLVPAHAGARRRCDGDRGAVRSDAGACRAAANAHGRPVAAVATTLLQGDTGPAVTAANGASSDAAPLQEQRPGAARQPAATPERACREQAKHQQQEQEQQQQQQAQQQAQQQGQQQAQQQQPQQHRARAPPEAVALSRRAKAARRAGRLEEALALLSDGAARWPEDVHLLSAAGSLHGKLGHHEEAARLLGAALALQPANPHLLTSAAVAAGQRGDAVEARRLFECSVAADTARGGGGGGGGAGGGGAAATRGPTSGVAVTLQAWAVLEASLGEAAAARALFSRARDADPGHAPVYCAWAQLEAACGDAEAARQLFREGWQLAPRHAPHLHVSGWEGGGAVAPACCSGCLLYRLHAVPPACCSAALLRWDSCFAAVVEAGDAFAC
jgi:tetratricopeptide (TPR) repeat protein